MKIKYKYFYKIKRNMVSKRLKLKSTSLTIEYNFLIPLNRFNHEIIFFF